MLSAHIKNSATVVKNTVHLVKVKTQPTSVIYITIIMETTTRIPPSPAPPRQAVPTTPSHSTELYLQL